MVENIFAVESSAAPSYEEIKKLPNKVLLWCGEFLGRGRNPTIFFDVDFCSNFRF